MARLSSIQVAFRLSWEDYNTAKDRAFQHGFGKPHILAKHLVLAAIAQQNNQDWYLRLANLQTMTRIAFRTLLQAMGVPPEQAASLRMPATDTAEQSRAKVTAGVSGGADIKFSLLPDEFSKAQAQAIHARMGSVHGYAQFLLFETLAMHPQERFQEALSNLEETVLGLFAQGIEHTDLSEKQAAWCLQQLEQYTGMITSTALRPNLSGSQSAKSVSVSR